MALMQSIRKNARLVLLFMAFAFILWIFLELGMNIAGIQIVKPYQRGIIAEIDKLQVSYDAYQNLLNDLIEKEREAKGDLSDRDMMILETKAFNELLFKIRFSEIQKKRKLIIDDQLLNTIIMNLPPPQILRDSSFWKKDSFDIKKYQEFLQNPENRELVLAYAKNITESYPVELMNLDITSMIHIPRDEVEKELFNRLTGFTFKYYQIPYFQIPDTLFKFNDDTLKKYYEKNRKEFKKKSFYKIGYVKIEFKPSKLDTESVLKELEEIKNLLINKEIDIGEAKTYTRILKYRKDTTFIANEKSRKYGILNKYKEKEITNPEILGDTAFLFSIEEKKEKEIKYKVLVSFFINTSYETRSSLREKAKNVFEIAKSEGLKKGAESYKLEYKETTEVPFDIPFIPGIGDYENIKKWIEKSKVGSLQKFWTPEGFYIIEILKKSPEKYEEFEEAKSKVKFMFLKDKKEKMGLNIAEKIIKGEDYDKNLVIVRDFNNVNFYDRVFGIADPDRIFGTLVKMEKGEKKKVNVPGSVIVIELIDKKEPSPDEVSAKINDYYQNYLSDLQRKIFNSFQQELISKEGVEDYRSNLLE
ncbi:MAG: SurA N-terminal domain-containing protein [candidate division WOR-3 bacterium]